MNKFHTLLTILLLTAAPAAGEIPVPAGVWPDSLSPAGGSSVLGREIAVHRFEGVAPEKVLIVGGIHGDEPQSVMFAEALRDSLGALEPGSLGKSVILVPLLNPDGYALKIRQNARGVDLNRNFPSLDFRVGKAGDRHFGGEAPASEPETLFLMELIGQEKPGFVVMLHTPYNFVESDGDSLGLGPRLARELGLEYRAEMDYPTPGSIGGYYGKERGLAVITLELPPREDVWALHGEGFMRFLEGLGSK